MMRNSIFALISSFLFLACATNKASLAAEKAPQLRFLNQIEIKEINVKVNLLFLSLSQYEKVNLYLLVQMSPSFSFVQLVVTSYIRKVNA